MRDVERIAAAWVRGHPQPWLVAQDAPGIVAEALVKAAASWDEAEGPWRPWLALHAKHALRRAVRDHDRHQPEDVLSLDTTPAPGLDPEREDAALLYHIPAPESPVSTEDRLTLRAALARLDRRQRLVLHLCYADGRTETQIGQAVGCSQVHAGRIRRRALEALRAAAS